MSTLFKLPRTVLLQVLDKFCELKDVGLLDSAYCNLTEREVFLFYMPFLTFDDICGLSHKWALTRRVLVTGLIMNFENLGVENVVVEDEETVHRLIVSRYLPFTIKTPLWMKFISSLRELVIEDSDCTLLSKLFSNIPMLSLTTLVVRNCDNFECFVPYIAKNFPNMSQFTYCATRCFTECCIFRQFLLYCRRLTCIKLHCEFLREELRVLFHYLGVNCQKLCTVEIVQKSERKAWRGIDTFGPFQYIDLNPSINLSIYGSRKSFLKYNNGYLDFENHLEQYSEPFLDREAVCAVERLRIDRSTFWKLTMKMFANLKHLTICFNENVMDRYPDTPMNYLLKCLPIRDGNVLETLIIEGCEEHFFTKKGLQTLSLNNPHLSRIYPCVHLPENNAIKRFADKRFRPSELQFGGFTL
jgi:hypothetical protein